MFLFGHIGEHKAWELEAQRFKEWNWFDTRFKWSRNCDHAGLELSIELIGFWISFQIYDGRHWNYDENRYYLPYEQLKELEDDILEDYKKIKDGSFHYLGVKKFVDDETKTWEERFKILEEHHLEESRAYMKQLEYTYSDFEEYVKLQKENL